MGRDDDKGPVVIAETGPPTAEHRKAARASEIVFGSALAFAVITGIAALFGFIGVALASAGICVALMVVAVMLGFESDRQSQCPDSSRPR